MTTSEVFLTKLPHVPLESYQHQDDFDDREYDEYTENGDAGRNNAHDVTNADEKDANGKANKPDSDLDNWLHGGSIDSDEYDTDLENDFPPGEHIYKIKQSKKEFKKLIVDHCLVRELTCLT